MVHVRTLKNRAAEENRFGFLEGNAVFLEVRLGLLGS